MAPLGELAASACLVHHSEMTERSGLARLLRRAGWVGLGALASGLWLVWGEPFRGDDDPAPTPARATEPAPSALAVSLPDTRSLSLPNGAPTGIRCDDALRVTAFMQRELSTPAVVPLPRELAEVWGSLLDPHGFWSASPDSPLPAELAAAAPDMLLSLHAQAAHCAGARRVARAWLPWQASLAARYDAAFESARAESRSRGELFQLVADPIFEDDPVLRPGLELAHELGHRLGAFAAHFPEEKSLLLQARARYLPEREEELAQIATLAALRAYVPLVDPHGDFAPFDEEWALYAGDDTLDPGSPLWAEVVRTPLGARVVADPAPPLEIDDLVIAIDGLSLAGASIDQIEQAARSQPQREALRVKVLRQGEPSLLTFELRHAEVAEAPGLASERIRYGRDGEHVLHVTIPDVGDGLAQQLEHLLEREAPGASGLLLDLRGNGGGSLDAAVESLGAFLPGARLFPLIHRGYVTEVLEAPHPPRSYSGPLAALVDGDTASAAEMLAGAIQAYERGVVIGARTFGKGCVQDYFDGVATAGVLRLTTLQFVMPNGKALQQIGLTPDVALELAPALERESAIARQPITYSGPDVRAARAAGPAWPRAAGPPGPCREALVCSALTRLSGLRPGVVSGARAARPRAGTR
jgi:carboxyl-terminal processing protease